MNDLRDFAIAALRLTQDFVDPESKQTAHGYGEAMLKLCDTHPAMVMLSRELADLKRRIEREEIESERFNHGQFGAGA